MVDSIGGKAISLHIRRTDHLIKPTYHPVLPLSYYEDALSKFPSDLPVIVFQMNQSGVTNKIYLKMIDF